MVAPEPTIEHGNSLFDQAWWLDATSPGAWAEVSVQRGGETVARLPYVVRHRLGLTYVVQPPLTQALGPWLAPVDAPAAKRLDTEKKLVDALIDELPAFDVFSQNFAPPMRNWLPFHWRGFTTTPRMTYRFEDLSDLDAVWAGLDADVRSQVRRAETRLEVRDDLPLDTFLELSRQTLRDKSVEVGYDDTFVRRVDAASASHGARLLLIAEDSDGKAHAGVYAVLDEHRAYYLMGGRSPGHERGATSLLLWHAIRRAAERTRAFDFEGSMIEPVERYFRSFGARQVPYLNVRKESRRAQALHRARRSLTFGR